MFGATPRHRTAQSITLNAAANKQQKKAVLSDSLFIFIVRLSNHGYALTSCGLLQQLSRQKAELRVGAGEIGKIREDRI